MTYRSLIQTASHKKVEFRTEPVLFIDDTKYDIVATNIRLPDETQVDGNIIAQSMKGCVTIQCEELHLIVIREDTKVLLVSEDVESRLHNCQIGDGEVAGSWIIHFAFSTFETQ